MKTKSVKNRTICINFVTAHDGFTLRDLVSYNEKHNEANKEGNNDGESHNRSWNCGAEGPTDDKTVNALRARQHRNFLTTLLLSQGVPMIAHGDELGRTQQGNNNVYCQDNALSWIDWSNADTAMIEFTRAVSGLRAAHPVFRRRRFFSGQAVRRRGGGAGVPDIAWFAPDGSEMTDEDWESGFAKSLGVYLNGYGIPDHDVRGQRVTDDSFVLFFNAHYEPIDFTLPQKDFGASWVPVIYTAEDAIEEPKPRNAGATVTVDARSVMVLQAHSTTS